MDKLQAAKDAALKYWTLRNAGEIGEYETLALLLSLGWLMHTLDEAGITWSDRDDAARIGLELLSGAGDVMERHEPLGE